MTPADEIEGLIRASIDAMIDSSTYYNDSIETFPEIYMMKLQHHYTIGFRKAIYHENARIVHKFKELGKALAARKILIENQTIYSNFRIELTAKHTSLDTIPIYYKDCVFTEPKTVIGENCENCIVIDT